VFNQGYYPTPGSLAIKMACMIDANFSRLILEPSAGKGDLVEAVRNKFSQYGQKIDCIELDGTLQATLSGKGFDVIDSDFMAYQPTKQYDTIIMNPPFSAGVAHVLKAFDIVYNGDVIAIVNAESIKNPCYQDRVLLNKLIHDNGTVEFIENAFVDADRKTGVEIALIHLKKRNSVNSYFDGLAESEINETEHEAGQQIAIPEAKIKNMVTAYNKAIDCKRKAAVNHAEADYYTSLILGDGTDKTDSVKASLNEFIDQLRQGAWRGVINLADFDKYATESVRKGLHSNNELTSKLEFTESNINQFLKNLVMNFDSIIEQCLLDVFDQMTRYNKDNRVYIEGWKSNDYFFINKRIVLPNMTEVKWAGGIEIHYAAKNKIRDIERVMSHLSGLQKYNSIIDIAESEECLSGIKLESTFFDVRFYKKGTAHFYFKDLKLLERFNLTVGRLRGWLPKQDKQVPEEFWLMNK